MTTGTTPDSQLGVDPDQRIRVGEPPHGELHEFLDDEAVLLDNDRLTEWLHTLAEDLVYRAPVRVTRNRAEGLGFAAAMAHFDDTYNSIARRIKRATESPNAWAVDPPSRVQRHISNVRVYRTPEPAEYRVLSYVLAVRSHADFADLDIVSAERDDLVRRTAQGLLLARRDIYLVQSTLGVPNLAFFL
ncbi:3-phenylpropionate/cinnamic acid dioxygenase subunit beta [Nocardia jinanensis]|uniref:3-phenylpropionate dioxygenase n=1 Tax=Nocardia jinanensis TaxID=382504 RepID=A0A917RMW2_9NOCA|nr:3-phenylpropionate/cinnamic acid dioxygenase subunit beta [Nocardia jinanensis]GGL15249.1 3-phenylpropionate dioxygenase [Nocardia jinanensis]